MTNTTERTDTRPRVPVPVRRAVRHEEHTRDPRELPPGWRPEPIPNRWKVN